MNSQPAIDVMRSTARTLQTGDVREKLRALQTLQDATERGSAPSIDGRISAAHVRVFVYDLAHVGLGRSGRIC